jgi:maleate cis-trans isomerase
MVDAMRHLGLQKVVLGAAYDDKVNAIARSFLEANKFNVLEAHGLGYVDNLQVGLLSAETAYDLAKKIDRPDADAILLACNNWKTMAVLDRLEKELGKPVVSTTQMSLWAALRIIGYSKPISGYGSLLKNLPAA